MILWLSRFHNLILRRFRLSFLVNRVLEMIFGLISCLCIFQQYLIPSALKVRVYIFFKNNFVYFVQHNWDGIFFSYLQIYPPFPCIGGKFLERKMLSLCFKALIPFSKMDQNLPLALERLLKLAIPNHLMWLISFYILFHSFLNILAEILQFADRSFFQCWWNATNLEMFWKNWNLPVHR